MEPVAASASYLSSETAQNLVDLPTYLPFIVQTESAWTKPVLNKYDGDVS